MNEKELFLTYLKDVGKYPLLKREREDELLLTYLETKNKYAIDKIVNSNLRLVVLVSKKYCNMGLTQMELINEGNLGLITAVKRFRKEKIGEIKFDSYAIYWIKQKMLQALNEQGSNIRLPANKFHDLYKIKKALMKQSKEASNLTLEHVTKETGIEENDIIEILNQLNVFSLDEALNVEGDGLDKIEREIDNKKLIKKLMLTLTDNEKFTISMYYGLDGTCFNLEEIGNFLNISTTRAQQIKHAAVKKLRKGLIIVSKEEKMQKTIDK